MSSFLSEDLVALRKFRKRTVRDMYESTRIPLEVIEEIESGFIFSPECTRNKTYVRSFIRTYAKALKISDPDITQALDLTDAAAYDGFIRKTYLPKAENTETTEQTHPDSEIAPLKAGEPRITADRASSLIDYKNEVSRPDPTRPHNQATPPPPDIKSINWVDMGNRFGNFGNFNKIPLLIGGFVIVIAAVTFYFYPFSDSEPVPAKKAIPIVNAPSVAVVDTQKIARKDTVISIVQAPITPVAPVKQTVKSLPDTLEILIYAVEDKLEPIRVRTDQTGITNPYWIEQGQAMRIKFNNSLYLKGQFGRMMLIFNGHPITSFGGFARENGELVIQRSYFEKDERWKTIRQLNTLEKPPLKVVDRPVFN